MLESTFHANDEKEELEPSDGMREVIREAISVLLVKFFKGSRATDSSGCAIPYRPSGQ